VPEVVAERRQQLVDAVDRRPQPHPDGLAGSLGVVGGAPHAP
jgi:hypothetical protein